MVLENIGCGFFEHLQSFLVKLVPLYQLVNDAQFVLELPLLLVPLVSHGPVNAFSRDALEGQLAEHAHHLEGMSACMRRGCAEWL